MDVADKIALGSGVVAVMAAVIAFWQARIARSSASEQLALAKQIHQEQNEPYVVVDLGPDRPGSGLHVLSIHNIGPTMARDVRIQVTPPLESTHQQLTPRLQRAIARTIPFLPPGRRLTYAFDTHHRWSSSLPMQFQFTVSAKGPGGHAVETLTYTVDLTVLSDALLGEPADKRLNDELKSIGAGLGSLAKAYEKANNEEIRAYHQRRADEARRQPSDETEG